MIRADFEMLADPPSDREERLSAPPAKRARAKTSPAKTPERHAPPPPAPIPAWARASGRAGEGEPLFAAGAGLALLDATLRADPPAAGALRARLALQSAAACAKILRLNADERALRDLRFAVGDARSATRLLQLWRDLAGRPPILDLGRLAAAAAALDLAVDPNALASSLAACAGQGGPVSAAGQSAALMFSTFPDAPAAEAEILALWAFDLVLAIRLRWPRPLPLIAVKLRRPGSSRRPTPTDPIWPNAAAGAIALAAGAAIELTADLARRSNTLISVPTICRSLEEPLNMTIPMIRFP